VVEVRVVTVEDVKEEVKPVKEIVDLDKEQEIEASKLVSGYPE